MNAHKFVAQKGFDEAKRVLEGAPACGQPIYYNLTNSVYLFTGYSNFYFFKGDWRLLEDTTLGDFNIEAISLIELKQVVESVDLVKRYGGVEAIENLFHVNCDGQAKIMCVSYLTWHDAKQAIADYELVESYKHALAGEKHE